MNTEFISKSAKKHAPKFAWTTVIGSIIALAIGILDQRQTSETNHNAAWVKMAGLEQRIEALELQSAYQKGYDAGLKSLTESANQCKTKP